MLTCVVSVWSACVWVSVVYCPPQILPRVPLVDGGVARVQPLYVQDLAKAIYTIANVRRC